MLCQRTAPLDMMAYVPPPEHAPATEFAAWPLPTKTMLWPVPRTSAAAGLEFTGLVVATGQPGSSLPVFASNAYTLPSSAPTTYAGLVSDAGTGEDSRNVTPG